jgi:hypothetical protein
MSNSRKLSAVFAATVAVSMLFGSSAFAETRHRDETNATAPNEQDRTDRTRHLNSNFNDRSGSRQSHSIYDNRGERQNDRNYNNRYDRNNNYNDRNYRNDRGNNSTYRNESRRGESFQGRVSRVERYNGGYDVWVGGTRYPFFIGADRWARFPVRVGLDVRLGGYWNPAGYYDVYDVGPYATAGNLRGVVENIDYRRGTLVMRDDVSGSFVTVVMRGNDPRFGGLRQGDYIDLTGAWNRSGVFDAYNVADIRGGYDRYDPRYGDGRGGY